MYKITLEKRDLFFKYLEEVGLDPAQNQSILEVAPSMVTSQSMLLAKRYGRLYKQFLVSRGLEQEPFKGVPINGILGKVVLKKGDLAVPIPFRDRLQAYYKIFKYGPFDTVLIQGQVDDAYSLIRVRQQLLFGDVCDKHDYETRKVYLDLIKAIQKYNNYGEYELCHDREGNYEYYLVKRKK